MSRKQSRHLERVTNSCRPSIDDWEEWDDEDIITPIDPDEQVLIESPPAAGPPSQITTRSIHSRSSRRASTRIQRLRSRHRQKAQNAKFGIRLITDMTTLRLQNHLVTQMRAQDGKPGGKFVDAAALRALEGEPSSASVGNWNWLKKGKSPASATTLSTARMDLTPGDAPIMIGFSLSPGEQSKQRQLPDSATLQKSLPPTPNTQTETPTEVPALAEGHSSPPAGEPHVSVWSPDTPETINSNNNFRAVSSIYSQATNVCGLKQFTDADAPPVPALPANYKRTPHQQLISLEMGGQDGDSDDGGTPCTLFEEDGTTKSQKFSKKKDHGLSPESAGSRAYGWWDHVVTPFLDKRFTFTSLKTKNESPKWSPEEHQRETPRIIEISERKATPLLLPVPKATPPPIVRAPTPRRTPTPTINQAGLSSALTSRQPSPHINTEVASEKPQIIVTPVFPVDGPPPYSPPKEFNSQEGPIRYRAVFPPGHSLNDQFPPSPAPGCGSPGLAATMTSQGATQMTEIPITPTVPRDMPIPAPMSLPIRPLGTSVPQEHSHEARGSEHRVERERRRHEKEEHLARKVGGAWRGRGCIPSSGCFGRTGREGRKRRRWCMGIFGFAAALIILAIVLGVVLTRPKDSKEEPSIWLNLTDFPPMPTGVMTVVGTDNTAAVSGCTLPSTAWSCSLPKDDQDSSEPYKPNQPGFIFQIQWDNSTAESWKVPNGDAPKSIVRRAAGGAAHASSVLRKRDTKVFTPNPSPPRYEEQWFLGETTDDIKSEEKAGEPAPFYISLLRSVNDTIEDPKLSRRQTTLDTDDVRDLVGSPDLMDDGTPEPAIMLPRPVQQPVRLYDRGLPTEHYGFYTYFKRTIYLKSVSTNRSEEDEVPLDEDGGCRKSEANFLVTWAETRMLVQIWTKTLGPKGSKLLDRGVGEDMDGSLELVRPGSMPYPVTVTLDTHGGNRNSKFVWEWPLDDRQQVDVSQPKLMPNDISFGAKVVNPRKDNDTSFGGFDGGTGGCKCQWVNWV